LNFKQTIDAKDREIHELLAMYEHLQFAYGAKQQPPDEMQDYERRRLNASETATNKDLYDVFLKSKKGASSSKKQ